MIACINHANGLGVSPAIVLRAAKEVERAHRHGQVGLFGEAFDEAVENSGFDVGVDFYPASGGKNTLHGLFGTQDQEIDHVAGVTLLVADAARELREEIVVDARK